MACKNQGNYRKLPRKPNGSKQQKLVGLRKSVPLIPVFCQALLQRREDIFKSQEANKKCLRIFWLLNTCRKQTKLLEVHLIRRNYDKNNELKLWKGSHSPYMQGFMATGSFFYITYIQKHVLDSNSLYIHVTTSVVIKG